MLVDRNEKLSVKVPKNNVLPQSSHSALKKRTKNAITARPNELIDIELFDGWVDNLDASTQESFCAFAKENYSVIEAYLYSRFLGYKGTVTACELWVKQHYDKPDHRKKLVYEIDEMQEDVRKLREDVENGAVKRDAGVARIASMQKEIRGHIDQVEKFTGVPADKLKGDNRELIGNLEVNIKSKLYGQDETVEKVLERVYVSFAGIGNETKPTASFLFLGPTGTGKTELAKLLSKNLDMPLLKYDMSEYSEKHSVSSFIGPPPGYVGFNDSQVSGGRLITDLSKNPHSIMLFDEVEKAHPDIFNIFLQMLDEGRITGSNGKVVSCKNTIIIMTSNLGSADSERNNIGFGEQEKTGEDDRAFKEFFKPEFRNRLDMVCKFTKLDMLAIKKIVVKFADELKKSLIDKHNITLILSEAAIDHLADKGYDNKMGARPLSRKIDELIRVPLSKKILFEHIKNSTITVNMNSEDIEFVVAQKLTGKVNSDGVIEVS